MTKLLTLFIAVILTVSAAGQVFYGKNASAVVNNAKTVRINPATKTPDYIRFQKGKELTEGQLREFLNKNYRLTNDFTWHKLNEITDDAGDIHIRYRLAFKGFPIHDAMFILHFRNGKIYAVNGNIPVNFKPANAVILSEPAALKAALNHINAKTYKWQIKEEEDFIKKTNDDPNATWFPKGRIQLKKDNETGGYNYVWVFDIYAHNPLSRADYYVSASDGSIVFVNNKIQHSDSLGTAVTKFSGSQPITADYHNNLFRLRESGRGNGIETYDMNNGQNYGGAVDFTDSDNYWNNVNLQKDEVAGDAHWGMEMTYDYYYNKHNRNSIDGNGFKLKGYVHYKTNYANAFWDGQRMTFGDGNSTYQPLVALDIVGHEISHGLTQFTADLDYSYESGALNEAYSDIFGTSIEFYAKPATANWLIGEDIGSAIRSMSNPKSKGDPDTYLGQNYYLGSGDNGGVHTNSSVLNHWYYLLAAGGQGVNDNNDTFNIQGVGVDTAGKIAFRTLTVYLINTSNFADCRFYSIQAAMDLYGPCSLPVQSTTSAFYAVGVGPDYVPGVNADFNAGITQYCTPSPVSFTNLSNNANSFHWEFGDGDTSTVANPTHNYTSYGNFTVKLIASGGSCGSDTTVKTAYISIDTTNPCITLMPSSGSAVKTQCQGILMDDGGTANYSNNTNSTITIAPAGASKITLTFTDFHFEKYHDYLKIYDGPNTQSPFLGFFGGDNLPNGGTIISSGGAITLIEATSPTINKAGFIASWQCSIPTTAPAASFMVSDTFSCSGTVSFKDKSTNGPTSWLWYFGDGDSSTVQNPVHSYKNDGYYTVSLKATNIIGSDTVTKTNIVRVARIAKPYSTSQSVCNGGSMTLHSSSTGGKIKWYGSKTSTTALDTGLSFTTPNLTQTKAYYVEEEVDNGTINGGKPDNSGGGGFLNYEQSLIFDAYQPFILHSVDVYSNSSSTIFVQLKNDNNQIITSKPITVAQGKNTIILDFNIPAGNNLKLTGSNLYRNNQGVNYPYTINGYLSINKSSATSNPLKYYYFFYNWQIKKTPCKSERTEVFAFVNNAAPKADFSYTNNDPYVSFTDLTQNQGTPLWKFGDGGGSSLNNPNHLYLQNGNYQVTLFVDNGCGTDSITKPLTIGLATNLNNGSPANQVRVYPNPATGKLNIDFGRNVANGYIYLIDITGRIVYYENVKDNTGKLTININGYNSGIYMIKIIDDKTIFSTKIIIE